MDLAITVEDNHLAVLIGSDVKAIFQRLYILRVEAGRIISRDHCGAIALAGLVVCTYFTCVRFVLRYVEAQRSDVKFHVNMPRCHMESDIVVKVMICLCYKRLKT